MNFKKILTTGKVFITSDNHFGHKNIVRGVTNWRTQDGEIPVDSVRDFGTIDEMNERLVYGINNMVGQDDTLIMLGDVSFGGFENIGIFLDRLVCQNIHLILGNHDHHIENNRENIQSTRRNLFIVRNKFRPRPILADCLALHEPTIVVRAH